MSNYEALGFLIAGFFIGMLFSIFLYIIWEFIKGSYPHIPISKRNTKAPDKPKNGKEKNKH